MLTMYEKLMMLPVFKGLGNEQLSMFLEKTHLEFKTYGAGDLIVADGEDCDGLKCVLSGRIESVHSLSGRRTLVSVEYGEGKVIGLDRLYGMDTRFGYSVRALSSCGTMEFSKKQYMQLLHSNSICLINLLNYLSYRSQKTELSLNSVYGNTFLGRLATIVSLLSDRDAENIRVSGLERMLDREGVSALDKASGEIARMEGRRLMERNPDGSFTIPSRRDLLDYAQSMMAPEAKDTCEDD